MGSINTKSSIDENKPIQIDISRGNAKKGVELLRLLSAFKNEDYNYYIESGDENYFGIKSSKINDKPTDNTRSLHSLILLDNINFNEIFKLKIIGYPHSSIKNNDESINDAQKTIINLIVNIN